MVFVYITIIFATSLQKVFLFETAIINNMNGYLNLTEMGAVTYSDTQMKIFFTVQNTELDHFDSSELSRYFNITYQVVRQTFTQDEVIIENLKTIQAKTCHIQDLIDDDNLNQMSHYEWRNHAILCPKSDKDLYFLTETTKD